MTSKAPFSHADGSNCWTKNCSKGNFVQKIDVSEALARVNNVFGIPVTLPVKLDVNFRNPAEVTGVVFNEQFKMCTTFEGGFDYSKMKPVENPDGSEIFWSKPAGGVWLASEEEGGQDSWNILLGASMSDSKNPDTVELKFKDSARVLVISSLEDYRAVLDEASFIPKVDSSAYPPDTLKLFARTGNTMVARDGAIARVMDFEKLATKYDGIMLTWSGLFSTGKNHNVDLGDACSLSLWDIESCFVFDKGSIVYR